MDKSSSGSNTYDYSNVTMLINTCDRFEDTWNPFFTLLEKYWPEHPRRILLNTQEKHYSNDKTNIETVCNGFDKSYTQSLRDTLKQINTEYVLFFLDDYFILKSVDNEVFSKAIEVLEQDKKAGGVFFHVVSVDSKYNVHFSSDKLFVQEGKDLTCRAYVVVTLFRKSYFMKLLCTNENPWKYERESYNRSVALNVPIYAQNYDVKEPCFYYLGKHRDKVGIRQSKWLTNTKAVFEENGIFNVNYDNLGFHQDTVQNISTSDSNYDENTSKNKQSVSDKLYNNVVKKLKYGKFSKMIKILYWKMYYAFIYKET